MKQVDGIYTNEDYHKVESYLQMHYPQMALFWAIGCDTGYRVSDILQLCVSDIKTGHISLVEAKTRKSKSAPISNDTLSYALNYVAKNGLKNDSYIFGDSSKGGDEPVSRQYVWRIIKQAGQMVGLPRLHLGHIQRAKRMRGESLWLQHHLTRHKGHSTTVTNQPRLGMSKEEWNSFLEGMKA